jgi:uncharacterized protein (DUF1697 family)
MTGRWVALLRGINVGKARHVAMADLQAVIEDLGYAGVRTLARSGNVVFTAPGSSAGTAAARIEAALVEQLGIASRVTVLAAADLAAVVATNPLLEVATDHSRLLVAFPPDPGHLARLEPLTRRSWSPEALAIGERAAYLWCPGGVLTSQALQAAGRALGDAVTTRNWNTVTKLLALAGAAR